MMQSYDPSAGGEPPTVGYNSSMVQGASKRRVVLLVGGVVAGVVLLGGGLWLLLGQRTPDLGRPAVTVDVESAGFVPGTVKIHQGQGVAWLNKDTNTHRLYADQTATPHLDSIDQLLTGDSYTYTFEKTGTFRYYDPANPSQFQGTVIVE